MKKLFLLFVLAAIPFTAKAQTVPVLQANGTPHSNTLSCTPGAPVAGVTVIGFNFYKSSTANGEVGTPALNGATPVPTCNFTDTNVTPGTTAFYKADAQASNGNHSVPSNEVSGTTPSNPNPPTVTITSATLVITGDTQTATVKWTDPSGIEQDFKFTNNVTYLAQGITTSANGLYAQKFTGPVGQVIQFTACNAAGSCATTPVTAN